MELYSKYTELYGIIRNYTELYGTIRNYAELYGSRNIPPQRLLSKDSIAKIPSQRFHSKDCKETLFGVHAQVSYIYIYIYIIPQTALALEGFLLRLQRNCPVLRDCPSRPTCLDLPCIAGLPSRPTCLDLPRLA